MVPEKPPAAADALTAPASSSRRPLAVAASIAIVLGVLFALGLAPRLRRRAELAATAAGADRGAVAVRVVTPRRAPGAGEITLPGDVQARRETVVFARTNGYVKKRLVDIGDVVTEGQLLAELEAPELDQEIRQAHASLLQARAGLEQATSSRDLARVNAQRFEQLAPAGVASQRDLDERRAALRVADANVRAAEAVIRSQEANAQRLAELKAFTRITAPFAGTVTARSTEIGALVSAGSAQGQGLFRIAEVDPLRVFVNVPQGSAPAIRIGLGAQVSLREQPGKAVTGVVTRTARALDPASRTMLTEIEIPNREGSILPGTYAQVKLALGGAGAVLTVPSSAAIFTSAGAAVALVGPDNRVHVQPVRLGADHGVEVEILAGLAGEEQVIANPSGAIVEGTLVAPSAPSAAR
jgi:RND family efflux transporter MFP subunit